MASAISFRPPAPLSIFLSLETQWDLWEIQTGRAGGAAHEPYLLEICTELAAVADDLFLAMEWVAKL